jgi:hypothetical protein
VARCPRPADRRHALAATVTTAGTAALISGYDSRWTIETCHQEAKAHGVGDARNRVRDAVERTVPVGFLTQTITIAWYQLHGNPDGELTARCRNAPWYRHKTNRQLRRHARRAAPRADPRGIASTNTGRSGAAQALPTEIRADSCRLHVNDSNRQSRRHV